MNTGVNKIYISEHNNDHGESRDGIQEEDNDNDVQDAHTISEDEYTSDENEYEEHDEQNESLQTEHNEELQYEQNYTYTEDEREQDNEYAEEQKEDEYIDCEHIDVDNDTQCNKDEYTEYNESEENIDDSVQQDDDNTYVQELNKLETEITENTEKDDMYNESEQSVNDSDGNEQNNISDTQDENETQQNLQETKKWQPDIDISDVQVTLPSIEECRSHNGLYTYDEVNEAIMKLAFMLIVDDSLCETEQQFNKSTYISKTDSEITIKIKL